MAPVADFLVAQVAHGALHPDLLVVGADDPVFRAVGDAPRDVAVPGRLGVRQVARVDGAPDVASQLLVGQRLGEERVLCADLDQLAAAVVQLPDVDVGDLHRQPQPLLGSFGALQRLDHLGDIIGRDDQAAHLASPFAPRRQFDLQPDDRAVGARELHAVGPEGLAREAVVIDGSPFFVGPREDIVERSADDLAPDQLTAFDPARACREHPHLPVGHQQRQRRGVDDLGHHPLGDVALAARRLSGQLRLDAAPLVGHEVGEVLQAVGK